MVKRRLILLSIAIYILSAPHVYAKNYAGLVVKHGSGDVVTRCVAFDESSISSVELLDRSGLGLELSDSSFGTVVYGIDGEGNASDWNNQTFYWSFWHLNDGSWSYSPVGAGGSRVYNGSVDGWQWMSQNGSRTVTLPAIGFDEIYQSAYGSSPAQDGGGQSQGTAQDQASGTGQQGSTDTDQAHTGSAGDTSGKTETGSSTSKKPGKKTQDEKVNQGAGRNTSGDGKKKNSGLMAYLAFGFITGGLSSLIGYIGFRRRYGK
jgi:hypothetical protein